MQRFAKILEWGTLATIYYRPTDLLAMARTRVNRNELLCLVERDEVCDEKVGKEADEAKLGTTIKSYMHNHNNVS